MDKRALIVPDNGMPGPTRYRVSTTWGHSASFLTYADALRCFTEEWQPNGYEIQPEPSTDGE